MSFTYIPICHAENSQRLKAKSSILGKSSDLDIQQGSEYASALLGFYEL